MNAAIFFSNIGLSLLGLVFIIWWNTVKAGRGAFNMKTWLDENLWTGTSTFIGICLAASLNAVAPDTLSIFHAVTGVDLTNTFGGWVTFAMLLYEGIRKYSSTKSKTTNP